MKPNLPPVLVVDDEPNMRETVREMLSDDGYAVALAESAEEALEMMAAPGAEFFMVITDGRLGGMSGYDLIRKMAKDYPNLQVILITAFATPKLAVEAIQAGAADYLSKPFAPEELLHAVERCRDHFELLAENKTLRARSRSSVIYEIHQIVGESPQMVELRQFIQTVAPTDSTVLILGESASDSGELSEGTHEHGLVSEGASEFLLPHHETTVTRDSTDLLLVD